jgi:1,2-diacylglycerol 3-beta-glucosyltransferase
MNVVRPLGREYLGLSAGLLGTGMAFSRELLEREPWSAFSYAEDREQHMRWVAAARRVAFAPETQVRSPMPTQFTDSTTQQSRWDSGRRYLLRALSPRLLRRALRHSDRAALASALEPVRLPQSLLLAVSAATTALGVLTGSRRLTAGGLANGGAQVVSVLGSLRLVHAPASVWRALGAAPTFAVRRVLLSIRTAGGRGPRSWERTRRAVDPAVQVPPRPPSATRIRHN